MSKALLTLLSTMVLASCAQLPPTPTPQPQQPRKTADVAWYPTHLYRGLRVVAGTVNQIDWSRASFGVSGNPATLSLFNNMAHAAAFPCWLRISVDVPGNPPPPPLVVGDLTIPNPPPGGANAGPWPVVFDNVPPGHWSIARATIGGASNNAASDRAAAVFTAMAHAPLPTALVRDGSAVGCH
ncbi:hypothetical protein J2X16_002891 [Pelomonas aquatica]|jgi:hypothetical protein|uniref:DUF3576 domain-containing protein n=1 Tax=Pelomonas aquatica TaxID=431058 RepID=A0ABU1ZAA5_9BURK|nr:hypothetical protein [Pelomonas aquatica]MDR7297542.1 hypothetical protein [Pelomonas aquatica]